MFAKSFKARLGSGFVDTPFDVKKEFGEARPPVRVFTHNGYSYRSTVAVYGSKNYVPFRRERREAARVKAGDIVEVTVVPDTEVRRIEPPPELSSLHSQRVALQKPSGSDSIRRIKRSTRKP
jgi:uncharacterized protein DUF1905